MDQIPQNREIYPQPRRRSFTPIIIILVAVLAFSLGFFGSYLMKFQTQVGPLKNSEIQFSSSGPCHKISDSWGGSGYCFSDSIEGETGLIALHPLSVQSPDFVYQIFKVPVDANFLRVKVSNLAGKFPLDDYYNSGTNCPTCDSFVKLTIKDFENFVVLEDSFIVSNSEGWIDKTYSISHFRGKDVILIIYSFAGGNEEWLGEWLGIGSVNIE